MAPAIGDDQSAATAGATVKSSQQRLSASRRRGASSAAVSIAGMQHLIALELCLGDLARVVIFDEHLPCLHRLWVAIDSACTTIDALRPILALYVGVDAGIEWVLQDQYYIAIPDRPPLE